jgi:hypothetical protein
MAIAYRSGSTAGNSSGGNLTITKPSGTADGDILIAVCYNEISASAWTPPAGWAQWGTGQVDNLNNCWVNVYWKRASSEGADYTFSIATTWRIIAMAAFSGAIASGNPIDGTPTGYQDNTSAVTAASITTTANNSMRVVGTGNVNGTDINVGTSGMTQGAELGGTEIWYVIQASAGASGSKAFSFALDGNWSTMHVGILQAVASTYTLTADSGAFKTTLSDASLQISKMIKLRGLGTSTNGTTSLALPQPSGTATDDVLVAFTIDHATSGNTTVPTGWTRQGGVAGTAGRFQIFTAVVGRNGLTGTSWTWSSLTTRALGRIIGYYNVNPAAPVDVTPSARLNASGTYGTTAVTVATVNALVLAAFASLANGTAWSAESVATSPTLTEQGDSANSSFCSLAIADGIKPATGSTGASTATPVTGAANAGILTALTDLRTFTLGADRAVFIETGQNATLTKATGAKVLTATTASISETGQAATLLWKHALPAAVQSYTLSGNDAVLRVTMPAAVNAFTLSGQTAGLLWKRVLPTTTQSYALSGQAAGLQKGKTMAAAAATFTETGQASGLLWKHSLAAVAGAFTETGQAAGLLKGKTLAATAATFTETGQAANLLFGRKVIVATGTFTETGRASSLLRGNVLQAAAKAIAETGQPVTFTRGLRLSAVYAALTLTGNAAGLNKGGSYSMTAAAGTFSQTGSAAGLLRGRVMPVSVSTFTETGQTAGLLWKHLAPAALGAFTLTGYAVTLTVGAIDTKMTVSPGVFILAAAAASLRFAVPPTAERTYDVTAELRALKVLTDDRTVDIAGESRKRTVLSETRSNLIPAETRKVNYGR